MVATRFVWRQPHKPVSVILSPYHLRDTDSHTPGVDVYIDFNNPADYSLAESVVDAFIANITFKATAQNLSLPYLYANNAADKQRPLRGYEEQNFKTLKEVAGKYDSLSVMQKLRNDGFLVSNE